jgi:hypothetical protein
VYVCIYREKKERERDKEILKRHKERERTGEIRHVARNIERKR